MATIKRPNELDEAAKRLNAARNSVENMTYGNFKSGDLYQGLQRDYQQQGQMAMKDTLGQVAARTGGMASSYAITAANQSYNNYMKALEDAARSMYNEEYSRAQNQYNMAQQDYNNAYSQYRDSVADQRYADEQKETKRKNYLDSIIKSAATGIAPVWDQTMEKNFGITEADFDNAVNIGLSQYKNSAGYLSNQAATDERLAQIFGAEGFNWNNFDWDNDGKVGKDDDKEGTAADYFKNAGSAYGKDYWEQYSKDAQQGYADADTEAAQEEVMEILEAGGEPPIDLLIKAGWLEEITPATEGETPDYDLDKNGIPDGLSGLAATMWQNNINSKTKEDIKARIANGEDLDTIAGAYGIVEDDDPNTVDKTWESVTGMSKAEWQQRFNENEVNNYDYPNTNAGRAEIIDTLVNSASFSLSDKDQKNFDHIFGKGAYKTLTEDVATLAGGLSDKLLKWSRSADRYDSLDTEFFNNILTDWINTTAEKIPGITKDQLLAVIEAQVPELYDWAENPDKAIPYIGKAYYNGKWITPQG